MKNKLSLTEKANHSIISRLRSRFGIEAKMPSEILFQIRCSFRDSRRRQEYDEIVGFFNGKPVKQKTSRNMANKYKNFHVFEQPYFINSSELWHLNRFSVEERYEKRMKGDENYRKNQLDKVHKEVRALFRKYELHIDTLEKLIKWGEPIGDSWAKETYDMLQKKVDEKVDFLKKWGKKLKKTKLVSFGENVGKLSLGVGLYNRARLAEKFGAKISRRGKDWNVGANLHPSWIEHSSGETTWKNGKAVDYTRAINNSWVRSAYEIQGQKLRYLVHKTILEIVFPDEFKLCRDEKGVKIVKGRDDLHLNVEVLEENRVDFVLVQFETNARLRREIEAKEQAEKADLEGVHVCLKDSLRAGNCQAGTLAFVGRLGLDEKKHYRAKEIFEMAKQKSSSDIPRVKLTLKAAILRTKKEEEQGFAVISEHFVG